jgi:hypothetical protein
MTRRHRYRFVAPCLALALAGCVTKPPAPPAPYPPALEVPTGQTLSFKAQAKGAQVYICKAAADDASKFSWQLQAPDATLYDEAGNPIGRHYFGPTWESADGSSVVGELKAKADSPDAGAIAWLLLSAKSTAGSGVFSNVKSVQRLNTVGGKAAADGCDAAHADAEQRVPYQASYWFYSAAP